MNEANLDTAFDPRALRVFEERNRVFRILYDTVLKVEGASTRETLSILCANLRKVAKAEWGAIAIFHPTSKELELKLCSSSSGAKCFQDDKRHIIKVDDETVANLTQKPLSHCGDHKDCLVSLFKDCFKDLSLNEGECYRLACVNDGELIAAASIKLPTGMRLTKQDLVESYLSMMGVIIQRTVAINALRESELALKKAKAEADRANKAKSNFLANVSHDIRTPMNSIIGFSELILESASIEDIHKNARIILEQSNVLLGLINQLLDIGKIESGKLEIENHAFDMHQLFQLIKRVNRHRVEEKELLLNVFICDDVPRVLVGDPLRLNEVLTNLISNAIKFTDKGSITVRCSKVETAENAVRLRFSVEDTGIGIPKDKQKMIFESFTQVDGSITRRFTGSGLGVTIADQIVRLLGGKIQLSSELGKGSLFWFETTFTLPVGRNSNPINLNMHIDTDTRKIHPAPRSGRILLVDDYQPNQLLVEHQLKTTGHRVFISNNGREALNVLKNYHFDLILMDLQMPIMDGFEATRRIRKGDTSNKNVPILALTANAYKTTRDNCLQAGMNGVITKPIQMRPFLKTINSFIAPEADIKVETETPNDAQPTDRSLESPSFDYAAAVEDFSGNKRVLNMALGQLSTYGADQLKRMKKALKDKDYEIIGKEAHRIKGAAANLHAHRLSLLAADLQNLVNDGEHAELTRKLDLFGEEFKRVSTLIREHV